MSRYVRFESSEDRPQSSNSGNRKGLGVVTNFGLVTPKTGGGLKACASQCSECGGEIKIFVSPKRNPHSSKLGRGVSMKDHDLCRRCWRKIMHRQRQVGVTVLPRAFFLGGATLRSRLLVPVWPSIPRKAS